MAKICIDECFLFNVIFGRPCFQGNLYWYSEFFINCYVVTFFETSLLKEVHNLCYLHNANTTVPKQSYHIL